MQRPNPDTHERLSVAEDIKGSSDRSFGIVMAVFFAILGLWPLLSGDPVRWSLVAIAGLFAVVATLRPSLLGRLNRLWLRFGLLLGRIVNPVVMAILFFGMITPFALVMRWMGKDPLRLRFDSSVKSYWIERDPPGPEPETMKHQF